MSAKTKMKSREQIVDAIIKARKVRDSCPNPLFKRFCNMQIRTLQNVLGYKVGVWYFCDDCNLEHKGLQCPKCGSSRLVKDDKNENAMD